MRVAAYDTSTFLNYPQDFLDEIFNGFDLVVIVDIVWQELKELKDSNRKTPEIRHQIKKLMETFNKHAEQIKFIAYKSGALEVNGKYVNNDDRINYCISKCYEDFLEEYGDELDFFYYTDDLLQYCDAYQKYKIPCGHVEWKKKHTETYKGFEEINLSAEKWEEFIAQDKIYDNFLSKLVKNEYLIIHYYDSHAQKEKDYCCKKVIRILDGEEYPELEEIPWPEFESYQFGEVKPKDCYQRCVMDSINSNQFTIITGPAGSGKSYLALAALFEKLDRHEIDKIVMLVNPVATQGSAKLGYYKGTRDEKLLDCQVGGFLSCKFGRSYQAQQYIEQEKLELVPFSDLRGLDFNDKKVGLYLTESQNLDKSMMKLAIQRAGEDSVVIIEGDPKTQLDMDIYKGSNNGMLATINAFKGEDLFGMIELQCIHRSRLAEIAERM